MTATTAGTCFGFDVDSAVPLAFLRDGGASEPLAVVEAPEPTEPGELLVEWTPTAAQPLDAKLFRDGERYSYWVEGGGWFLIEPERARIAVPAGAEVVRREERMWSLPVALCFAHRGDVPLHAAAVEVEGEAVLLAAPRTWGKTTLAAGFVAAGYRLLSEDLSCVRASEAPLVIPGPAMLRIRHDVADRISVDGAEPVGRDDDRVHFALQPSTRGSSSPVPLRALVLLRPSDEPPCLTRVPQAEALPDLWSLGFRLPGEASFRAAFGGLAELVDHVPVWNFFRPVRLDALDAAVEALVAGLRP